MDRFLVLNRRQLLRVGLAVTAATAATAAATAAQLGRTRLTAQSAVPTSPYSREISNLLVRCCDLAGEQYRYSKDNPDYDGSIRLLNDYRTYRDKVGQYRQIGSFQMPELGLSSHSLPVAAKRSDQLSKGLALSFSQVFWGYALTSAQCSIIALRGTQTESEMATGATAFQLGFGSEGRVHAGFYLIYQALIGQIRQVAEQFDPELPCYLTGYSLGSAVAILAAATLAKETALKNQLQVYTYAGPRVGNPAFAQAYNQLVPQTYRVVNQADIVTDLPLENFRGDLYRHVGQELAYSLQCGNFDRNHAIGNYRQAVDAGLEVGQTQRQTCA
ncbi:MAG: lipase family protein [Pegethrix bostrychoides GSE-TBD4-15B]|uniref:Lipase family protein n=1 Tax=Pegethrix bostrychoides GSE-TBD4-15B TaxID=2839662 RepID=A0A951P9S7_9CYAN|nr:lipase family protein [Pegethrix bostrychoides GSE-TBD4-15B]